jgi:hypothetical protein
MQFSLRLVKSFSCFITRKLTEDITLPHSPALTAFVSSQVWNTKVQALKERHSTAQRLALG